MSPRPAAAKAKANRRRITLLWIVIGAVVVISLLYWEQTALLYILATVSVSILLVVVALADLRGPQRTTSSTAEGGDSAALGIGIPVSVKAQSIPRQSVPRKRPPKRI